MRKRKRKHIPHLFLSSFNYLLFTFILFRFSIPVIFTHQMSTSIFFHTPTAQISIFITPKCIISGHFTPWRSFHTTENLQNNICQKNTIFDTFHQICHFCYFYSIPILHFLGKSPILPTIAKMVKIAKIPLFPQNPKNGKIPKNGDILEMGFLGGSPKYPKIRVYPKMAKIPQNPKNGQKWGFWEIPQKWQFWVRWRNTYPTRSM